MKCEGSGHLDVAMKTAAPLMHGLLLILLALSACVSETVWLQSA